MTIKQRQIMMNDYCKRMIPWHIKEARRDIRKRDFFAAEMNIAIAERMINGTWFNELEFKRLLVKKTETEEKFPPTITKDKIKYFRCF